MYGALMQSPVQFGFACREFSGRWKSNNINNPSEFCGTAGIMPTQTSVQRNLENQGYFRCVLRKSEITKLFIIWWFINHQIMNSFVNFMSFLHILKPMNYITDSTVPGVTWFRHRSDTFVSFINIPGFRVYLSKDDDSNFGHNFFLCISLQKK